MEECNNCKGDGKYLINMKDGAGAGFIKCEQCEGLGYK